MSNCFFFAFSCRLTEIYQFSANSQIFIQKSFNFPPHSPQWRWSASRWVRAVVSRWWRAWGYPRVSCPRAADTCRDLAGGCLFWIVSFQNFEFLSRISFRKTMLPLVNSCRKMFRVSMTFYRLLKNFYLWASAASYIFCIAWNSNRFWMSQTFHQLMINFDKKPNNLKKPSPVWRFYRRAPWACRGSRPFSLSPAGSRVATEQINV